MEEEYSFYICRTPSPVNLSITLEEEPVVSVIIEEEPMVSVIIEEEPVVSVIIEEEPMVSVIIEEEPMVLLEEEPMVLLEEEPMVLLEEEPMVLLEEEPVVSVIIEEEPVVILEEEPMVPIVLEKEKEKKNDFSKIVALINNKIKNGCKEYHFRPVIIDGVYCYIVLYLKYKIFTIESINVKCKFNNHYIPYVLYHKEYTSITKLVNLIHRITTNYRILNGDFMSLSNYNDMKTEEILIPYKEEEVCCVCLENTTDTTTCNHFICFKCRDKCIIQQRKDCPMCRQSNVLGIYCNNMNLINNSDYSELSMLFNRKFHDDDSSTDDDDNNSTEDELREVGLYSSSDEDEDGDDEEGDE